MRGNAIAIRAHAARIRGDVNAAIELSHQALEHLPEDDADPDAAYEQLRERFLKEVRAKKTLTRPLTLPPDAKTAVP